jgi:ceramide glucosyltransferase
LQAFGFFGCALITMQEALTIFVLFLAIGPLVYYLLAIYSSWIFFKPRHGLVPGPAEFAPPVSNLKPIKGVDADAYENFATLCRQDYPEYELIFCVDADNADTIALLEKLQRDFPEREIRILLGSGRVAANDKAAKLARLVAEAKHEVIVINDSDVRARPDYLKTVVQPLADPEIGAVTLPYVPIAEHTFADELQSVGMFSDFFAGIFVARMLDGVKFALGPTIATTRSQLRRFGGYEAIENRPGDDLLIGRLIAEQGYRVELLPYAVETVADFASWKELFHKRMRWMVVMRHMRAWGHLGLAFTQGLPWSVAAALLAPSLGIGVLYLALYLCLRVVLTWIIGSHGLKQKGMARKILLIPIWDAMAFLIWAISFTRRSVRWRGSDYYIREGLLVPVATAEE